LKYIEVDKDNVLIGRYDSEIHTSVPGNAIEVKEELFELSCSDLQAKWVYQKGSLNKLQDVCEDVACNVKQVRSLAYADPIYGSDKFLMEALFLQLVEGLPKSSPKIKTLLSQAKNRKEEIKTEHPYVRN
jgi:hypothetical protein